MIFILTNKLDIRFFGLILIYSIKSTASLKLLIFGMGGGRRCIVTYFSTFSSKQHYFQVRIPTSFYMLLIYRYFRNKVSRGYHLLYPGVLESYSLISTIFISEVSHLKCTILIRYLHCWFIYLL